MPTESTEAVSVTVYNMSGKVLDAQKVSASELNTMKLGENYASGIYQVEVVQGTEARTLEIVKQ